MAVAMQHEEENADEDADIHNLTARAKVSELNDHLLLEELRQAASIMAGGGTADDWEEAEEASDSDSDDQDSDIDSKNEGTDDGMSTDKGEDDDDLGPEDGEDEGYLDTGYGAL
jgi:hypothetical protein